MAKKTGLGKGLNALFSDNIDMNMILNDKPEEEIKEGEEIVKNIKVIEIEPNRNQPRKIFDNETLDELAESVKRYGVIQPIIVNKKDDYYEIVAGERRWRAAKKAGLNEMPCIVRENDERRNKVREELNIADKELIAYMPTWRGTLGNKDTDEYIETLKRYLEYLSKNLKENQLLYVNVHPYVKDYIEFDDYENILAFPKQYETYDFLNVCDILITDYSSVFFDFALTKRKIVLFTYDEEKYLNNRGLYESLDNLPFPRVYTVENLLDEINNKEIVNYSSFLEKFCNYDRVDIPRKICSKIILRQENNLKIINMPQNGKENVLILIRNFSNKEVNKRFFELVNNTNDFKYNYYIGYISRWMRRYSYNLLKLPKEIKYMGQLYSFCNISLKDKVMFRMYNKYGNGVNCDAKTYEKILKNELKRIYNNINFKTIVLLGEEKDLRIKLFSKYDNCFKILYNPDSERANLYSKMYDYIISDEEFEKYNDINEIVELGEM